MQVLLTLLLMNAMNWLSEPNNQACALHHCIFVLSFTQLNKLSLAKGYVLVFVFQALPKLPYPFNSIVFQALHKLPYPNTLVPTWWANSRLIYSFWHVFTSRTRIKSSYAGLSRTPKVFLRPDWVHWSTVEFEGSEKKESKRYSNRIARVNVLPWESQLSSSWIETKGDLSPSITREISSSNS